MRNRIIRYNTAQRLIVLTLFLACQVNNFVWGQPLAFNHLTSENGLSNNSVLSITQDGKGFIWLGTSNGLNRFDGWQMKVYQAGNSGNNSGLLASDILSLLCNSKKDLWVGTGKGLNRYNEKADRFETVKLPSETAVLSIFEDHRQRLWIGTVKGLYLLSNPLKPHFTELKTQTGDNVIKGSVNCIYEDGQQNIWIGSDSGLTRLSNLNGQLNAESFYYNERGNTLSSNAISSIYQDVTGAFWIGTLNAGLNKFNYQTKTFTHFSKETEPGKGLIHNNVRSLLSKNKNELWIGTQEGLSILNLPKETFTNFQSDGSNPKSLSQNSIYSLFKDANGSMWVGTYFGGGNRVDAFSTPFKVIQNNGKKNTLNNNVISSIVEDKNGNLWIGTEGGGLSFLNRKTNQYTEYKNDIDNPASIASNLVKFVYLDADENVWCGTHGGGLNVLDRKSGLFKHFLYAPNQVKSARMEVISMAEDDFGRLWIATNNGTFLFKKNGTELTSVPFSEGLEPLKNLIANAIYKDSLGAIWIGGVPGLYKITNTNVSIINKDIFFNAILPDGNGNLWLTRKNNPPSIYNIDSKQFFDYKNSLGKRNIVGLLKDKKGLLWLSTDAGLLRFDPNTKTFNTYSTSDGLAGKEFNYNSFLQDSKGIFYFGGYLGITYFNPEEIEINNYHSPLVFTGLLLNNSEALIDEKSGVLKKNINQTTGITLNHNQNLFSINFALLNYIKSNKNRYSIKLSGFDHDWKEVRNPSATYTNLPSGDYVFQVRGANNDGIWTDPISMHITVLPPFWRNKLAYLIYLILIAGIVLFVTRFFFMKALFKKEEELHQNKLNFFTHVSHEIRTHLTLIMVPIEKLFKLKEPGELAVQLNEVKNNSDRLLRLVNELMDFRKAEANQTNLEIREQDLVVFIGKIYNSFKELSQSKNIQLSFETNANKLPVYFDEAQLEKVFFNLLVNAFKFTPDGGQIQIGIHQKMEQVEITIADSGRGIAEKYLDKLFTNYYQVADDEMQNTGYGLGLALSKKIVELHHGSLHVESRPVNGSVSGYTCFFVKLLIGKAHFEKDEQVTILPLGSSRDFNTVVDIPEVSTMPENTIASRSKEYTILIIEDNVELRKLIKQHFEADYIIHEATDGITGWDAATNLIPDLIISDVMMPGIDGLKLCSKLKLDERTSHIPVILLTAKSTQADEIKGLENGADVYITKPFTTRILELNVRNLLDLRGKLQQQLSRKFGIRAQADQETDTQAGNNIDNGFLQTLVEIIDEHLEDPEFGVEKLSRKMAMSPPILYKKLRALTNLSVNDFIKTRRFKKAASLILNKELTINEVAYTVGYEDRKYFSREFKKYFGVVPTHFTTAHLITEIPNPNKNKDAAFPSIKSKS